MTEYAKKLWLQNYRGEGDCAELEKTLKTLKAGSFAASYVPWAVAERIFKFQDGEIEYVKINGSTVEVDRTVIKTEVDTETGVITERNANAYFVNVKVSWQGNTYTERYPLLDHKNQALVSWNQADINKAHQRAKVKAIAIVSGIGYKLFEDGDLQFENDSDNKNEKIDKKVDAIKEKTAKLQEKQEDAKFEKADTKPVKVEKGEIVVEDVKIDEPKKEKPKVEKPKEEVKVIEVDDIVIVETEDETENVLKVDVVEIDPSIIDEEEMRNTLKNIVITRTDADKAERIINFLKAKGIGNVTNLNKKDLQAIYLDVVD